MKKSYGLGALMEAMKQSETAEAVAKAEEDLMENATDDEVKRLIVGDDSVENDLAGNGISEDEEKRLEEFIKKIPEATDEDIMDDESEGLEETLIALEACTKDIENEEEEED